MDSSYRSDGYVKYNQPHFHDLELCRVLMVGSHDAGINEGKGNAQTQLLDIGQQAICGARVFDIRIGLQKFHYDKVSDHGEERITTYEHRALHADKKVQRNSTTDSGLITTKLLGGTFGQELQTILSQSLAFVDQTKEFIILKFDKSHNPAEVARMCVDLLPKDRLCKPCNLNRTRIRDLCGKVVILFTSENIKAVRQEDKNCGIMPIINVFKDGNSYTREGGVGLYYYGKGGTSVNNPHDKKLQSLSKQGEIIEEMQCVHGEVLGMVYITATGILENIQNRDDKMWGTEHCPSNYSDEMFKRILLDGATPRIPKNVSATEYSSGTVFKTCIPNIVMIDFVEEWRCKKIFGLNFEASNSWIETSRKRLAGSEVGLEDDNGIEVTEYSKKNFFGQFMGK
jgi:hypothetical protein